MRSVSGNPFDDDAAAPLAPASPSISATAQSAKQPRRASFFDADHANLFMEVVTHSLVPRHVQDEILNLREHLGNLQHLHSRETELQNMLEVCAHALQS